MSYLNRLRDALNAEDLERFVKYNPSTRNVRKHPDMHGPGDPRFYKKKRSDAGTIDFYHYGGKKSKETEYEEMFNPFTRDKESKEDRRARKDWQKVAEELGINRVKSEDDVLKMIEYVRGNQALAEKPEPEPEPEPLLPRGERVPRFNEPPADEPSSETAMSVYGGEDRENRKNYFLNRFVLGAPEPGGIKNITNIYQEEV